MNLLLFDIDGTLTDTSRDDDRIYLESLHEMAGAEAVAECGGWEKFPEVTDPAIARAVLSRIHGRPARDEDIFALRRTFIARWKRAIDGGQVGIAPIAGAREIVVEARRRPGFVVALATGGWGPTALLKVQHAGLAVDDLVIASADDDEARAVIFRTAAIHSAAAHGIPGFSNLTVVGDGIWDARAARTIGAGFVGVASDPAKALCLVAEGAVAVVPDFQDTAAFWSAVETARVRQRASGVN